MKKYDIVIFDLDSTLVKIEGLDWLAKLHGREKEVSILTKQSMEGKISFQDALAKKMKVITPSYNDLVMLGGKYCKSLVEDVKVVIKILHILKKEVWILTGNFNPAVCMLARTLKIPSERIIHNRVFFNEDGTYRGFDINNPLSKNGGKVEKIKRIVKDYKKAVFVGDGYTDLEVKDWVGLFIGYGGVAQRELVINNSDIYIKSKSLSPVLSVILNNQERKEVVHSKYNKLFLKSEDIISRKLVKGLC